METALLSPLAVAWLWWYGASLSSAGPPLALLALSGAITTAPLLMFAGAAKRIRYADYAVSSWSSARMEVMVPA